MRKPYCTGFTYWTKKKADALVLCISFAVFHYRRLSFFFFLNENVTAARIIEISTIYISVSTPSLPVFGESNIDVAVDTGFVVPVSVVVVAVFLLSLSGSSSEGFVAVVVISLV